MNAITTVENALADKVRAVFGLPGTSAIRQVETLPGGWTQDMLRRAMQFAPGVYIAFLGGQSENSGGYITARFAAYVVTKAAREEDRRRGNAREIGAYDIIDLLAKHLDMLDIADIGTALVRSVENVFNETLFELGGTVYALMLEIPNVPWTEKSTADLMPFVTFEGTHSLAPGPNEPAHQTKVTLDQ